MTLTHKLFILALSIATVNSCLAGPLSRLGKPMAAIDGNVRFDHALEWAVLERQLIDKMDAAAPYMVDKYVDRQGDFAWPPPWFGGTDALDDAYESFHNFALFYAIGGDDRILKLADRNWDSITEMFSEFPSGFGYHMIENGFCSGYDWMHMGEGYMSWFSMGLADPNNPKYIERARRFAGLYLNEIPGAENYDFRLNMIKCAHSGGHGPCYEHWTGGGAYAADLWGIPFYDLPGIHGPQELFHTKGAMKRMGEAAKTRYSHGDVAVNLACTSLMTNAYLFTGDEKYKQWVMDYVDAWRGRIAANNGVIPDNIGPSGKIGECMDGRWYGGVYGWSFPHGWLSICDALTAADQNSVLLSGDKSYMRMLSSQVDMLIGLGTKRGGVLYVPHKRTDPGIQPLYTPPDDWNILKDADGQVLTRNGWFEFMPMHPGAPLAIWYASMERRDLDRLSKIRNYKGHELEIHMGHSIHKDLAGLQLPWVDYLGGSFPNYPEQAMRFNLEQVEERWNKMRQDKRPRRTYDLLSKNPISTEGLLQLTMGAPQPVYNGGLLQARIRHFDWQRKRPGLPKDVAALVEKIEDGRTVFRLVNLNKSEPREDIVQAGAYGEHVFVTVNYTTTTGVRTLEVNDKYLFVHLDPGATVTIDAVTKRYVGKPSYALPWQ